ncbi:MAG: PHP domain-containing protein [Nanohaloarchaea archaeon]|nr:PHP domain-containing protein [Candidatus Nanohaloarchaea archaeon]
MESADLHMHTTASDGTDSVDERVEQAKENGIRCIAVTDHDAIPDELNNQVEKRSGVEVITGSEIKCEVDGEKIEILAYFIDPEEDSTNKIFKQLKKNRQNRMKEMVRKLDSEIREDIRYQDVVSRADGTVGRPHLAKTLEEKSVVKTSEEAFEKLIGSKHEAYVETPKIPAEKVINLVHEAGGVTSLAHPGRSLEKEEAFEKVKKLKQAGLDAIEVEYTYQQKIERDSFTIHFAEDYARQIADRLDLLKTGGTDCHGSNSEKFNIGDVTIPYKRVEKLRSRASGL